MAVWGERFVLHLAQTGRRGTVTGATARCNMRVKRAATARAPRTAVLCMSAASESQLAGGPPQGFDTVAATAENSAALALAYPQLARLVADGIVLALHRPQDYAERRSDGYIEPRLVVLVGVAHLSTRSSDDVVSVINTLRPKCVCVELCRSRTGQLYDNAGSTDASPLALTGDGSASQGLLPALQRALRLGGGGALLLRALLAWTAQRATSVSRTGAPTPPVFGAEFAAARRASDDVGATLVLGDRPIEITLQRALDATTLGDRLRAAQLLVSTLNWTSKVEGIAATDMDSYLTDTPAVDALLQRFTTAFPQLATALVHERDAYLAWSLCRSKAVNGADIVVGVVGKAHVRGIVWAMQPQLRDQLRFDTLTGRGDARQQQQPLWQRLVLDTAFWGGLWLVWQAATGNG